MNEIELLKKLNKSYKNLNLKYYKLYISFVLMLVIAFLEMAGLSLLYPLMLLLGGNNTGGSVVSQILPNILPAGAEVSSFCKPQTLFLIFAVLFVVKNLILFFSYRYNIGFATYYYKNFVKGIYTVYLNRSALSIQSDGVGYLTNIICVETRKLIDGIVRPCFVLLTEAIITLSISLVVFLVSPLAICMVIVVCAISLIIYYKSLRKVALTWGGDEVTATSLLHELVQNTARGISEIRIFGRYKTLIKKVEYIMVQKIQMFHNLEMYQQTPRYIIETMFIVTIMAYCAIYIFMGKDLPVLLAQFSIIIAAAFRILPGVNRIVGSYSNISFHLCPAISLMNIVFELEKIEKKRNHEEKESELNQITFLDKIDIKDVTFKYPSTEVKILSGLNLQITKHSKVGIVGISGCGKSTFIKILAGLYPQSSGTIFVDGVDIFQNIKEWQSIISYVPQEAFIMPGTIRENISFDDSDVCDIRVWNAIEQVGLMKFVKSLPNELSTMLGGKELNLSGGQRQLICLARVLYNKSMLILLDEPTASLDSQSERIVLDVINNLSRYATVVMISHKIENFSKFDEIYLCKQGRLQKVSEGILEQNDASKVYI
jgi:ATP-binding cassette, subfamily B, bacterial PglK